MEDTPAGILLKRDAPKNPFPPTRLEDVCGVAKYDGPAITVEAMNQAVADEVRARWERFERTGTDYEDDDEGG